MIKCKPFSFEAHIFILWSSNQCLSIEKFQDLEGFSEKEWIKGAELPVFSLILAAGFHALIC